MFSEHWSHSTLHPLSYPLLGQHKLVTVTASSSRVEACDAICSVGSCSQFSKKLANQLVGRCCYYGAGSVTALNFLPKAVFAFLMARC